MFPMFNSIMIIQKKKKKLEMSNNTDSDERN